MDETKKTENSHASASRPLESVWDYPRPPRIEPSLRRVEVVFAGVRIVDSRRSLRVLETSHPPVYYIPLEDIAPDILSPCPGTSWCEWKGAARYFDVVAGERTARKSAWSYPDPTDAFASIKHHVAFYPHLMDACFVNGERVTPQPGGFYGGWITSELIGPFKGVPGSMGW